MTSGIALDASLDVMVGTNENGFGTIAFTSGANMIIQRVVEKVSMSRHQIWYQWQYGLNYEEIFINNRYTFDQMRAQQIANIRKTILSIDGVQFIIGKIDITKDEVNRSIKITIPCLRIFCDNAYQEVQLGAINVG
ncbi:hypothetical protein GCM10009007_03500 [Formosimonas limnophila]|uniref:Uncharacterized protein n=1 Tax=Formosimonas limnophila TaxID=1384487 RepID=A0A8J3CJR7_9BURK|nr:hypothetical protein [Formosimonas limnophila]GHA66328.1 hypothetical protein GCM10009007_03500 [Formosimonas limnophila]